MPSQDLIQMHFGEGLDACSPSHLVPEGSVQAAENVDFSLERGAVVCRRGSGRQWVLGTAPVYSMFRRNAWDMAHSPRYANCGGQVYRCTNTTWTSIVNPAGTLNCFAGYNDYTFISCLSPVGGVKDDGIFTTDWVKQAPGTPTVSGTASQNAITLATAFVLKEGTVQVGTHTATYVTYGTVTNTQTATYTTTSTTTATYTGTATGTCDASTQRIQIDAILSTTNLSTSASGSAIGNYGYHGIDVKLSNPAAVTRLSCDYSIGDTSYTNYWHADMETVISTNVSADAERLIDNIISLGTDIVDAATKASLVEQAKQNLTTLQSRISWAKDSFSTWFVHRPMFQFIGSLTTPGWEDVRAMRIVIEADGEVEIAIKNIVVYGNNKAPLTDLDFGYSWVETWATLDTSGNVIGESAPGTPTGRTKLFCASPVVTSTSTATGLNHDITHRIFYRQGGYLQDYYAVATLPLATATFTDTVGDMEALLNDRLETNNILPKSVFSALNVRAVSEPYQERLFFGEANNLWWSLPGRPDAFPGDSNVSVSHGGDEIYGLVVWPPGLVVVNRDSVYEMRGNVFEGTNQDWILQRTGCQRGNWAPQTIIKTPYGIPLIDYTGISMYLPGQGVDTPLDWAMEKMADAFRGFGVNDPAALKGSRIPAINGGIFNSCAAYADGKLYLGVPTGNSVTVPNTLFVLDFRTKQVWYYTYPFTFRCIWWDALEGALYVGSSDGKIMRIESGTVDYDTSGQSQYISWKIQTRAWTTPADTRLENIAIDYKGGTATAFALIDGTTTQTVGTLTSSTRDWFTPSLSATIAKNVVFQINGTQGVGQQCALYGLHANALVEPPRVSFLRTEPFDNNHPAEKLWDTWVSEIETVGTGTVLATVFVDNTATMTATITSPSSGVTMKSVAFPTPTYGLTAYTVYSCSDPVKFKHWSTSYGVRNEPPRVNSFQTDIEAIEEQRVDGVSFDLNPNGTVVSTVFVDNVATSTFTNSSSSRKSFAWALPAETFGRTVYAIHTGTNFKHYRTWWQLRREPDRVSSFVSSIDSGPEALWQEVVSVLNPLSATVLGTVIIDGTAVSTLTASGNGFKSIVTTLPSETYGRSGWVVYNGVAGGVFKHYQTSFTKRPEPDRVANFLAPYDAPGKEVLWESVESCVNCLGNIILGTVLLDGTAITTATLSGSGFRSFLTTLPARSFGREAHVVYSATLNGTFKHYSTRFNKREDSDQVTVFMTPVETPGESIWDAVNCNVDCQSGTVLSTVFINNSAISTFTLTGSGQRGYTNSLPTNTFGRTAYVLYTSPTRFKHFATWYDSRKEPERVTSFVTERQIGNEQHWQTVTFDLDPCWSNVISTIYLDNLAVATFTNYFSSRESFVYSLGTNLYGRDIYAVHTSTGTFKHYRTTFAGTPEPPRVTSVEWGPTMFPSDQIPETWVVDINPLGTATGVLYSDDVALATATFTGTTRQVFNVGIDLNTTTLEDTPEGKKYLVVYTASQAFKHYSTSITTTPKPFGKRTWMIDYTKIGGASQLDMPRFWSIDIESLGTATSTLAWDADGVVFSTSTITTTSRQWLDRQSFPAGFRGRLFRLRLLADKPVKVWSSALDMERVGVKGFSRLSIKGKPSE